MTETLQKSSNEGQDEYLFTVVIIAYNVGDYIGKCIESAIDQTTRCKYEILVIDDGSKDRSGEIIDSYVLKSDKVRVIHKENEGSGFARNTGIRNAKGKWLMFVDGDDYIDRYAIEKYEKYTEYDIDVCLGRISSFLDGSNDQPNPLPARAVEKEIMQCENGKACFVYLRSRNSSVELGTKGIYRREFLVSNNIYMKQYKRGQDNDWAVRVFQFAGKMSYNDYPYYCYREGRTGSAVNAQSIEKAVGVVTMEQEWFEIAKSEGGDFGEALREETIKCYWFFFKLYASAFKGEVLKQYCEHVDKARYIYKETTKRQLWMRLMDGLGAYKTIVFLKRSGILKAENIFRKLRYSLS